MRTNPEVVNAITCPTLYLAAYTYPCTWRDATWPCVTNPYIRALRICTLAVVTRAAACERSDATPPTCPSLSNKTDAWARDEMTSFGCWEWHQETLTFSRLLEAMKWVTWRGGYLQCLSSLALSNHGTLQWSLAGPRLDLACTDWR